MQLRIVGLFVALWASLAVGITCFDPAAPQDPPAKVFRHDQHVGRAWARGATEVFRDCRGCHRFSAGDKFSSPQAVCNDCHQGGGELTLDADDGWQNDLAARSSRTGPAFRHHTHGMLSCRQCHEDTQARGRVRPHLPITTGPAFCATCHDRATVTAAVVDGFEWYEGVLEGADGAQQRAEASGLERPFAKPSTPDARAAYAQRLHDVFGGPDGGINTTPLATGGKFDHGDHIGGTDPIACKTCHTNVRTAKADEVGTGDIPTDGCERCHQRDASGAPARAADETLRDTRRLWSLGTFAHVDHYPAQGAAQRPEVATAQAYQRIGDQDCEACHTYAPENPGFSERDFPFNGEASEHRYQDCVGCHDVAGWKTGERGGDVPPLHSSNGGDGWQDCAACHVFGQPDLKTLRPSEPVQRWTERTYRFEGQTHPHITTTGSQRVVDAGGESLQQDCATCHRANVPSLPTRLIEKAFRHATHLPANPTAESCTTCHSSAVSSDSSATLVVESFRTYDLGACKTCHWGGDVIERVDEGQQPAQRMVVSFPHKSHVAAGAKCADCHTLASSGGDMQTAPDVADCTKCHQHERDDAGARPVAERLVRDEVQSCSKCHHADVGGDQVASVPAVSGTKAAEADPRYQVQQVVFAGFRDSQFHPLGTACTECHTVTDQSGAFSPIRVKVFYDHFRATSQATVHAPPPNGFGAAKPEDCLRCHWKSVSGYEQYFSGDEQGVRALRKKPGSDETRAEFGDAFDGYPGTDKAKG